MEKLVIVVMLLATTGIGCGDAGDELGLSDDDSRGLDGAGGAVDDGAGGTGGTVDDDFGGAGGTPAADALCRETEGEDIYSCAVAEFTILEVRAFDGEDNEVVTVEPEEDRASAIVAFADDSYPWDEFRTYHTHMPLVVTAPWTFRVQPEGEAMEFRISYLLDGEGGAMQMKCAFAIDDLLSFEGENTVRCDQDPSLIVAQGHSVEITYSMESVD